LQLSVTGRFPRLVVTVTIGYLAVGLLIFSYWLASGDTNPLTQFFRIPGALLLVCLAAMQLGIALRVCRELNPGEPLQIAWRIIVISAACNLLGSILIQVLSLDSLVNPLHYFAQTAGFALILRDVGLVMGGVCRFAPLAAGLFS